MEGYDVVFARRKAKQHSLFRVMAAKAYFRLINFFTSTKMEGEHGSFSILSRKVVQAFLLLQDRDRHYLFILRWLGFKSAEIEYEHGVRFSGESAYSTRMLINLALDGIFFQTTVLLRWIVYLGFWVATARVLLEFYIAYAYLVHAVYPCSTDLAVT